MLILRKLGKGKKHLLFLLSQLMVIPIFATIYWVINKYEQGTHFKGLSGDEPFIDFLYYSMVTQTTVGYGDITPISSHTRILAMAQMLLLYLGLLLTEYDILSYFGF